MRWSVSLVLAALCLAAIGCGDGGDTAGKVSERPAPTAAAAGIDEAGRMHPGPDDRCPVCAMTTADKKLGSAIELDDGRTWYTCGTGCLLKCWLHPEVFLGAGDHKVRRAVTTEFFSGEHRDAAAVVWIAGSDVVGPMGPMMVPVADDAAAARFRERHGGAAEFHLEDLDDTMWRRLTGNQAGPDD